MQTLVGIKTSDQLFYGRLGKSWARTEVVCRGGLGKDPDFGCDRTLSPVGTAFIWNIPRKLSREITMGYCYHNQI